MKRFPVESIQDPITARFDQYYVDKNHKVRKMTEQEKKSGIIDPNEKMHEWEDFQNELIDPPEET